MIAPAAIVDGFVAVARRGTAPARLVLWLSAAVSATASGQIFFTEAADPDIEWQRDLSSYPMQIAFSTDAKYLILLQANDRGQTVTTFDAANGADIRELTNEDGIAGAIAVSAHGRLALAAPGHVDLLDLLSARPVVERFECAGCNLSALAFSADGSKLAMQDARTVRERLLGIGLARILDLDTKRVIELEAIAGPRGTVAFSRDGGRLLTAHTAYLDRAEVAGFKVWDAAGSRLLYSASFAGSTTGAIATGAVDGAAFVAVNANDGNIEMRDLMNETLLWSVPMIDNPFAGSAGSHTGVVLERVAIAGDGSFVVSYERPAESFASISVGGRPVRESGGIVVRRARDGSIVAVYDVPGVTTLAASPDGKTFAFATPRQLPRVALVRAPQ